MLVGTRTSSWHDIKGASSTGDLWLRSAEMCVRDTAYSRRTQPIAYFLFPIACCLLPIACCLLPIVYCLLPIVYCLLPIVYCLLPIGCLLFAVVYWLLAIVYWLLAVYLCFSHEEAKTTQHKVFGLDSSVRSDRLRWLDWLDWVGCLLSTC
jgi:hypothetical protein